MKREYWLVQYTEITLRIMKNRIAFFRRYLLHLTKCISICLLLVSFEFCRRKVSTCEQKNRLHSHDKWLFHTQTHYVCFHRTLLRIFCAVNDIHHSALNVDIVQHMHPFPSFVMSRFFVGFPLKTAYIYIDWTMIMQLNRIRGELSVAMCERNQLN